jgi:hypothetical protein
MHWILDNKEWLFSGIAVAVIAAVIGVFYRRFVDRPSQSNSNVVSADRNGSVFASPQASGTNINQTINIGTPIPALLPPSNNEYHPAPLRTRFERAWRSYRYISEL